ncbi:MAG: zinc ribbon domain-containing protein [Chloroflexi bacterium]|nr:zinc ribbon domain-containing protein [Chloroflexota bacterium]
MPIYVYKCPMGHEFERRQGFNASTLQTCPTCNAEARRRIYSPAVIYKGGGFYTTDYARKNLIPAGESKERNGKSGESTSADATSDQGSDHGHAHPHAESTNGKVEAAS